TTRIGCTATRTTWPTCCAGPSPRGAGGRSVGVGLDALFALREVSGKLGPDPAAAAMLAGLAGAEAVRLGVCEEGRPVSEADLRDVARAAPIELRIAPTHSLVKVALEARPVRVVLATETRAGGFAAPP